MASFGKVLPERKDKAKKLVKTLKECNATVYDLSEVDELLLDTQRSSKQSSSSNVFLQSNPTFAQTYTIRDIIRNSPENSLVIIDAKGLHNSSNGLFDSSDGGFLTR